MTDRYDRAVSLLEDILALCNTASKDAFKNGVTDCSGTTDEGDVRAGQILGEISRFLQEDEARPVYSVGELIFFLQNNRVHSAPVLSRQVITVCADRIPSSNEQEKLFRPFGPSGVKYATCHGIVRADEAFFTQNALADSLRSEL
jgi:hypothetical protein